MNFHSGESPSIWDADIRTMDVAEAVKLRALDRPSG
jgi:hypothetical protein